MVVDGLKARSLPSNRFPEARVVDLSLRAAAGSEGAEEAQQIIATPTGGGGGTEGGVDGSGALGPEYRRALTCPNPEETNSAVEVTFQVCLCVCVFFFFY